MLSNDQNNPLIKILQNKEAVIFCGAGVSLEPPAGLPNWHNLRDYTLQAVASKDSFLQKFIPDLTSIPMIDDKNSKGLTPEVVASEIHQNCGGYFECFRALEDGQPNANHQYLSLMAKSETIKHIVTTNFDLFIENSLQQEGILYQTYRTLEEFAHFDKDQPGIHILKIHGCISFPETIIATVEQEGSGLPLEIRNALQSLLEQYYFIFWGYSGADLKIDMDYLAMLSNSSNAKGFIWNFLQNDLYKEPINPYVAKLAEEYQDRARIVHGKLPNIFEQIVAQKIPRQHYDCEQEKQWQQQKNAKLLQSLKIWADEYLDNLQAINIYASLLAYSGQNIKALQCQEYQIELCRANDNKSQLSTALNNIGNIYETLGEYDKALVAYEEALQIDERLENNKGLGILANNIGNIHYTRGDYHKALEYYEKAKDIDDATNYHRGLATDLNNMGMVHNSLGNSEVALKFYKKAEEIDREIGDKKGLAVRLNNIGILFKEQGDYENAMRCYQEAQQIHRALGDKKGWATALNNMGSVAYNTEKFEQAIDYYQQAQKIDAYSGNKRGMAIRLNNIGLVYKHKKLYSRALEYYKKAIDIVEKIGDKKSLASLLTNIGSIYDILKDYNKALQYNQQAETIYRSIGNQKGLATSLNNIGTSYRAMENYSQALAYYQKAREIDTALGDRKSILLLQANIASTHRAAENYDKAITYYEKGIDSCRELQDKRELSSLLNGLGMVHLQRENFVLSLEKLNEALQLAEENADKFQLIFIYNNIAKTYHKQKNLQVAMDKFEQAIQLAKEHDHKEELAMSFNNAAVNLKEMKKYTTAMSYSQQAYEIADKINDAYETARALHNMGNVAKEQQQLLQAKKYYKQAETLAESVYNSKFLATIREKLAQLEQIMGSIWLRTARLTLRPYTMRDMNGFVALNADPIVRKNMDGPKSLPQAKKFFLEILADCNKKCWAVIYDENYIGHCFLAQTKSHDTVELGFLFFQKYWGQGFASETAKALVNYARNHKGICKVIATVDNDHSASISVLHKAGLKLTTTATDDLGVYYIYSCSVQSYLGS